MNLQRFKGLLGQGDMFMSQDLQSSTFFGDYRVVGAVMNVSGYNDFLSRLTRRDQAGTEPAVAEGQQDCRASGESVFCKSTLPRWRADWSGISVNSCSLPGSILWPMKTGVYCCCTGGRSHYQGICDGADRCRT